MTEEPQAKSPRRLGTAQFLALVAALALGVFLGIIAVGSLWTKRSPVDLFSSLFIEPPQQHFAGKDRIAVLLMGIDYNYDAKDQPYSTNARTDTLMALALNFPTADNPHGSIGLLSVPRDTDYVFPNGHEDKINAAYGMGGNPLSAAHRAESAVARLLGIRRFDRFITLRIDAAKEVVDAIGGIDVIPDETMDYDDSWGHLHIHFKGGKLYHMNGDQAVSYSRFRHDACSDPCRIKRQQQVMRIVLRKLESDKFNDLVHFNSLLGVVRRNVVTDISDREALSIAAAMRATNLKGVKMEQVPFLDDKSLACCGDVLVPDTSGMNKLVRQLFINPPVEVAAPTAQALAAVSAHSISVDVLNGSGTPGAARRVATMLRTRGFRIASVGNADSASYDTTEVRVSSAYALQGHKVRAALPMRDAVVRTDGPARARVTVVVGHDIESPEREADATK